MYGAKMLIKKHRMVAVKKEQSVVGQHIRLCKLFWWKMHGAKLSCHVKFMSVNPFDDASFFYEDMVPSCLSRNTTWTLSVAKLWSSLHLIWVSLTTLFLQSSNLHVDEDKPTHKCYVRTFLIMSLTWYPFCSNGHHHKQVDVHIVSCKF